MGNPSLTIVYCLNQFLPQKRAGTEVYVWALAKAMQRRGHKAVVIIPHQGEKDSREYEFDGIRVIQYAEPTIADRTFMRSQRAPDGLPVFLSYIKEISPSVVHVHEYNWSNGITLHHFEAVRALGIHTFMTLHLAGYSCRTGRLMYMGRELCDGIIKPARCARCALDDSLPNKTMARALHAASLPFYAMNINPGAWNSKIGTGMSFPFLIRQLKQNLARFNDATSHIIVLTRWYKKMLLANGIPEDKMTFIPQGLSYTAPQTLSHTPMGNGPVRLIFIGRIDPFKGLHLLLEALSSIPTSKITLDIYGQTVDEDYYKKCKDLSASLPNVQWKGTMDSKDVLPALTRYDALCLPSTFSEMSPLVIQEAFAAGIPVIGSSVYGIAEQVQDGVNGFLFTFNDSGSLKQVLQRITAEPKVLSDLAENIKSPASFEEIATATELVYQTVLNQSGLK